MSKTTKALPSETELLNILAKRFAAPAWSFLRQVSDGTGGHKRRTADAVAMSLWPSNGLDLYGFEVKRTRADLKHELENPDKADAIAKFCRYWYLILADAEIADGLSVPQAWGILVYQGRRGLVQTHKPSPREDVKILDPPMLAAILRRVQEQKTQESTILLAEQRVRREEASTYSKMMTDEREAVRKAGEVQDEFNAACIRVLGLSPDTWGWKKSMESLEPILGPILNTLGNKRNWHEASLPKAIEAQEWAMKQLDDMVEVGERVVNTARDARERLGKNEGKRERTTGHSSSSTG